MNRFPDRRYFDRIARESGFRAEPLETVFRLTDLLCQIDEHFGNELCLRGGTALNLLHLDIPRLSVDIDVDFVGSSDATTAQARRVALLEELGVLATRSGYDVSPERASYAMAHLSLRYLDSSGRASFMKFDVNFLDRVPVLKPARLNLRHPFDNDLPRITIQTHALPELAAGKIVALARRSLARDLFDVAMLAALSNLDAHLVRTALVIRGAGYPAPSPLEYSTTVVDKVRRARWRSEVLAVVRRPVPFELAEAKSTVREFLGPILKFERSHHKFLESLEDGELRPELLASDEIRDRIAINPALLWRLRVGAESLEER